MAKRPISLDWRAASLANSLSLPSRPLGSNASQMPSTLPLRSKAVFRLWFNSSRKAPGSSERLAARLRMSWIWSARAVTTVRVSPKVFCTRTACSAALAWSRSCTLAVSILLLESLTRSSF
ncbi:hypothetical protein D3C85_1403170 [compost metagenome]